MRDRFAVLCVAVTAVACGAGERAGTPAIPDAAAPRDARPDAQTGPSGPTAPTDVRMQDGRCLITREAYRAWAKDSPCLATADEMLARGDAVCAEGRRGPDVFRCNGNLSFPRVDQVKAGTVCTYDGKTGAFLGAEVAIEGGFAFCGTRGPMETEPVVEHCGRWLSGPGYCGAGVSGMPADAVAARPVTFTLRNATTDTLIVDDPDGLYRRWSILVAATPLALDQPSLCECPNQHCIVDAGQKASGRFEIPPGGELTWVWDGRVGTLVTAGGTCERLTLAPTGPLLVRIPYRTASADSTAEAMFDNPTTTPVIVTAR